MQIPPLKKSTFYIVIILVLLVGIILGGLFVGYVAFYKFKSELIVAAQPPEISTKLTPQQIENATSLESNKTMFGKVVSKEINLFTLQLTITNPLDAKNSTTTTVRVPFDSAKDEVIIAKSVPSSASGSTVETIKASFSDIKVGAQVLVKILDGKKTIYLPSSL